MDKFAVVVVHGIGPGTGEDRHEFSAALRDNVRKMIPAGLNLIWDEADWEGVNDKIDSIAGRVVQQLCSRYIDDVSSKLDSNGGNAGGAGNRLWRIICSFLSKTEKVGLHVELEILKKAKQCLPDIVDAAIDLPLYMQNPKKGEIRGIVSGAISAAAARAEKVVLIGHSLGSVIAFDVAEAILSGNGLNHLAALVTMGSPLNWVTEIRRTVANGAASVLCGDSIPWVNFWDPEDPVTEFKKLDSGLFPHVRNIEVKSGKKFIEAHCCYWNEKMIAESIAKMLAGDFEWINSLPK